MSVSKPRSYHYSPPLKRIYDGAGLQSFQRSIALRDLTVSLTQIAKLVEDKDVPSGVLYKSDQYTPDEIDKYEHDHKIPTGSDFSDDGAERNTQLNQIYREQPIVEAIVNLLKEISTLIDNVPPLDGPRRYGNFACRTWHDELESHIDEWLKRFIVDDYYKYENANGFLEEIKWYIVNAFGSRERLDYGTGHELNFLAFITGLIKVNIISLDKENVDGYGFLVIFGNYYNVARKLIITYTLEPAGSHGVWGLDDYFHIIYILGSSQVLNTQDHDSQELSPKYTQNKSIVYQYSTKNLYFNSIAFIFKVKKGPFFEHSPILYDVSNVKNWTKVVKGMFKMFQVEVVGKFPVVQHFYFGGVLFPWLDAANLQPLPVSTNDTDEHTDDDKTPTPNSANEISHDYNQDSSFTAVPWKSKKPAQSLSYSILNNNPTTRVPLGSTTNPQQRSTRPPTTGAPWARK
jgi:serine/threonine-protein phosphatase 2A activator